MSTDERYILELKGISKSFPGVKALDQVQLQVKPGEVHALMGENGAGKSTLMKILMGIYSKDEGEMFFDGKPYAPLNPKDAMNTGIAMIHQELNPILDLPVYENLFIGRELKKNGLVDKHEELRLSEELLKENGLHVPATELLRNMTVAQCQLLEIIKAISINARIIIMDEPTASITEREVDILFEHINDLKDKGVAIIYISHRMEEIFKICDRITVFRDGQFVGADDAANLDNAALIRMMVGREITDIYPKADAAIGDVVFEVKGVNRGRMVKDAGFRVRSGEILGLAGLVGAGRSELVEGVFGMAPIESGEIFVRGKKVDVRSPKDIIKEGVALITEDRKGTGLNLAGTVNDNIAMVAIKKLLTNGLYNRKKAEQASEEYIQMLKIKTPSGETIVGDLSGGNQQKVVLAKWLLNAPDIIILDEPTRGIDVGAKRDIYLQIGELAKAGKAVVMISSEIPELMGICDRIDIMAEGRVTGELAREDFSQERIMEFASAINV